MNTMSLPDPARVAAIIEAVAATEIMGRFRRLSSSDVRTKSGPADLVTVADEAGERRLQEDLTRLLPGSILVGEEGTEHNPDLLNRIAEDRFVWIADPLDGTHNFVHGVARFATIVALAHGGRTLAGWIHDPVERLTYWGTAGGGAYVDGRRLTVAAPAPLAAMTGVFSRPRSAARDARDRSDRLSARLARRIKLACAGLDYVWLLEGRAHITVNGLVGRLKPWDHAAGVLLHGEAGGHSALLDGTPYAPTMHAGGLLLAPDAESWRAARAALDDAPGN